MKLDKIIEAKKNNNIDLFSENVGKDKKNFLSNISEIVGKRAYFTIDEDGNINRKEMNYSLPLVAFSNNNDIIGRGLYELIDPKERVKHKKIDRMSTESVEGLEKKFYKIFANGNTAFALRYAKELYLRDKEKFFYRLFHYVLMEDIDSKKALMALALKRLLLKEFDDNIMTIGISYITQVSSDLKEYELAGKADIKKEDLDTIMVEEMKDKTYFNTLAYIKVLMEYSYPNEDKFLFMIDKKMKKRNGEPLSEYEVEILKGL